MFVPGELRPGIGGEGTFNIDLWRWRIDTLVKSETYHLLGPDCVQTRLLQSPSGLLVHVDVTGKGGGR